MEKKERGTFVCLEPLCYKGFTSKLTLQKHVHRVHPKYLCPDCGINFSSQAKCLNHKCEKKSVIDGGGGVGVARKHREDPFRHFVEGGKYDIVAKIRQKLSKEQNDILDTFTLTSQEFEKDPDNFKTIISVFYNVGKIVAELEPLKLVSEDSKYYLQINMRRFLHSIENLKPHLFKTIKRERVINQTFQTTMISAAKTGFSKKEFSWWPHSDK